MTPHQVVVCCEFSGAAYSYCVHPYLVADTAKEEAKSFIAQNLNGVVGRYWINIAIIVMAVISLLCAITHGVLDSSSIYFLGGNEFLFMHRLQLLKMLIKKFPTKNRKHATGMHSILCQ